MKISYLFGDLIRAPEPIIAHGCNCMGVMGAGVALQIKKHFPEAYKSYRQIHEHTGLHLNNVIYVKSNNKIIANCLTQQNVGSGLQVDYDAVS